MTENNNPNKNRFGYNPKRELRRNENGQLTLEGRVVEVETICPPSAIDCGSCPHPVHENREEKFKKHLEEIRKEVGADCYEFGEIYSFWSTDPGFGTRYDNIYIQFYKFKETKR